SIIGDADGRVTTGLLTGTRYLKDNRLLPRGFDKASANADIAVLGDAAGDVDFAGGSDRVTYAVDAAADGAPFQVEVALRFQPIGFRWARNLAPYRARDTQRFVGYYNAMAGESAIVLAKAITTVRGTRFKTTSYRPVGGPEVRVKPDAAVLKR